MMPNLNNFGVFIPHFNSDNAMDADITTPLIPPPTYSNLPQLPPQERAVIDFFQKTFLIGLENHLVHLHSHLSNQSIELLFNFIKEVNLRFSGFPFNQNWIDLFRCIFQIIEERVALGNILNSDQLPILGTFYNLNKIHIPELSDEQGYPICLLLHHFNKYPINILSITGARKIKEHRLQIIDQEFLKPMQALKISPIFILNLLRIGQHNAKGFKENFWSNADMAFNVLRFLKKCQLNTWIAQMLIPEKIDSARKLFEFHLYVNLQERQKLVEKLFKNVKFQSPNEVVLTAPPAEYLDVILASMENIAILRLEQSNHKERDFETTAVILASMDNPKKRAYETTSETEQSISKFAKTAENRKRSVQNEENGLYPFGMLPKCLQVLDLTKISKINLSSMVTLSPKTKLHVILSTSSDFEMNGFYQPWPKGTLITIGWHLQEKRIPAISLFPNVHHILHVGEINESDPALLGVIRDMPGIISFQIDSELDELALPVLEKLPILPRIFITRKNLHQNSLRILESLYVKHRDLTLEMGQKILFRDLFSDFENFSKDFPRLSRNVWEQNVNYLLNKQTGFSLEEGLNARFLFEVFIKFVQLIRESERHHYFSLGLSLGLKIRQPITQSNGNIILKAFENLFVSEGPHKSLLLYWAEEILKFPPPLTIDSIPTINRCFDLCFSYFDEDPTFFVQRLELLKKMMQEPLNCYLLHYLAEEKKGHLRLLEFTLGYFVSNLLKHEYPASSLGAWNKVFDKLYRITPTLGAFYPKLQEPIYPGHYHAANYFIANHDANNSKQMSFVVEICLKQEVMREDQIAYCKHYIFSNQASHSALSKLLARESFQELVLKMLIDKLEKIGSPKDFLDVFRVLNEIPNYENLDRCLTLLLTLFHRISGNVEFVDHSPQFYTFIKRVVYKLEAKPELYQTYPNLGLFLIKFLFPIKIMNQESEEEKSRLFIELLKRFDADTIPMILDQLYKVLFERIQNNKKGPSPRLHESTAYQLIVDHMASLKQRIWLANSCLHSVIFAFNQDPNFLQSSSLEFIENCSELMLHVANHGHHQGLFSYSPVATLIINRLRQQFYLIPTGKFHVNAVISSLCTTLDDEQQKYCLEIIQKHYDIPLEKGLKKCEIKSENVLFVEGLFQFLLRSDAITPQTMRNTLLWLQVFVKSGFVERSQQLLEQFKEHKLLNIKDLHESGLHLRIPILDKDEKQQLLNMFYKMELSSRFDKLKSLVKPQQIRIKLPLGADNLDLNRFLDLLEELKLGTPNSPIDIKAFTTYKLEKPSDFKFYMARLLTHIRTRNPNVSGVPKNSEQRELFYREIENGFKASLYIILEGIKNNKEEIMEDYPIFLLKMCDAGSKCGQNYQDCSIDSYSHFIGRKIECTPDIENQLLHALHDFAWNCARKVIFMNVRDMEGYMPFVKFWESLLGPQNRSLKVFQEADGVDAYLKTVMAKKELFCQQFAALFTVDTCIETLYKQFKATANEANSLAYEELFNKYDIDDAWGEMLDEPRHGLRKLLEKWGIIKNSS